MGSTQHGQLLPGKEQYLGGRWPEALGEGEPGGRVEALATLIGRAYGSLTHLERGGHARRR